MAFSEAGHLRKHINGVHNGQKDHKCDSCGKSFSSAQMMKYHIKAIHNNHKCDICGKSFSQGRFLNRHINAIHNLQNNINNS